MSGQLTEARKALEPWEKEMQEAGATKGVAESERNLIKEKVSQMGLGNGDGDGDRMGLGIDMGMGMEMRMAVGTGMGMGMGMGMGSWLGHVRVVGSWVLEVVKGE